MAWKKPNKELTEFLEEKMASFDCQKKMMKKSQDSRIMCVIKIGS